MFAFIFTLVSYSFAFADDCPDGAVRCGTTEDGLTWSVSNIKDENGNDTQQLTITGSGNMKNYDRVGEGTAPWKDPDHQGGLTNSAPTITRIVIGEGVTSIGARAFEDMRSVTSVSLPEGLKSVGLEAFNSCFSLSEVNLPNSLESLGGYAFYGTALSNIDLPDNMENIDYLAFGHNTHLSSITIPENTHIAARAFENEQGVVYVQNVYCAEENASCQALKNRASMEGRVQLYESNGNDGYFFNNKWYASPNDIIGDNHIKKRIYTIDEATKVSKEIGNTFKLRYK